MTPTITTITLEAATKFLWDLIDCGYTGIIHITATKKDGTIRNYQGKLNVKKFLKGGSAPYDFKQKGLFPVGDVELMKRINRGILFDKEGNPIKTPYRSIKLSGLISYTVAGVKYIIKNT